MRNYLSEMLYALTSAYSRRDYDNEQQGLPMQTNIGKLFSILAWGFGEVEEQAELIRLWDDLNQAKGTVLDRYGANWGVRRFNENDALFRLAIIVKVMSQLSGGDTDTVIKAAAELLGVEYTDVTFEDVFPAKIALYVDWLLLTEERQELIEPIAWFIKRILAAGVGMRLYIRTYRTYRYDFLVNHGGGVGTFFSYEPIGRDREEAWDLNVIHAGSVRSDFSYFPVVEDREAIIEVPFTHSVAVRTDFDSVLVEQDRSAKTHFDISRGSDLKPELSSASVSPDISIRQAVSLSRGMFLPQAVSGAPPGAKVVSRHQSKDVGGVYTRTRIKPKRID